MVAYTQTQHTLLRVLGTIVLLVVSVIVAGHGLIHYENRYRHILADAHQRAGESLSRLQLTITPMIEAYTVNEYEKLVLNEAALVQHLAIVVRNHRMGQVLGLESYISGTIRNAEANYVDYDSKHREHADLLKKALFSESTELFNASGERLGSITIYVADDALRAARSEVIQETLLVEAVTIVSLFLMLMYTVQRLLVRPISDITSRLQSAGPDGLPKIELLPSRYRELNVLSRTINRLMRKIGESREALDREHRRLEDVIHGTNVGVWEWQVQSGKVSVNARWAEIIGYTLEELQPISINTWTDLVHPDDLKRSGEKLQQHFAGESAHYECEARMRHKRGHWVWILDRGRVSKWTDSGQPALMAGTHQDITAQKEQALRLADSEARFRSVFEKSSSVMLLIGAKSGIIEGVNQAAARFYRYPRERLIGMSINEINTLSREQIAEQRRRAIEEECNIFHFQHRLANGEVRDVEVRSTPIQINDEPLLFSIVHDISDRVKAEAHLRLAASVFDHAREAIVITDPQARIVDVNEAFTQITGYSRAEVLGKDPKILSSGQHDEDFYCRMWRDLEIDGHWYGELWNKRKNGELFAELLTISRVSDEHNNTRHYVGLFSDITAIKENERELEQIAHYDSLTGLPNRLLLADRLRQAMLQETRRKQRLAVVFLDLDGFKSVNDAHGHDTGDQLLVKVSKRIRAALRDADTLARLGGDEFVAVLSDLPTHDACLPLLNRMLDAAAGPVAVGDKAVQVSASLGVTFFPQSEDVDADQLLRQADQAMYQAKLAGKNRYHLFDADQDRHLRGRRERIERIEQGLRNDEFELFYQPKVNMRDGSLVGVEALIRWHHPDQGLLLPGRFLPAIEGHPLMIELGEWTLHQALKQLEHWQQQGLETAISVNIAATHLQRADFVERLRMILAVYPGISAQQLELEILETSALENTSHVSRLIEQCQRIGVSFALDDFGTGYSSLTYLKRLPAETLKIDRSFVRDMHDDPEDLTILEGVISLASAFQRQVIAEGVETEEHGELLLRLGCDLAQGFVIAKPMPGEQLVDWLSAWQPPQRWLQAQAIDHARLPILFAMVQHRAWINALEGYLAGTEVAPPPLDPSECRLGRWLDSGDVPGEKDVIDELQHLHLQVHQVADELFRSHTSDQLESHRELRNQLVQLRGELIETLERLLLSDRAA